MANLQERRPHEVAEGRAERFDGSAHDRRLSLEDGDDQVQGERQQLQVRVRDVDAHLLQDHQVLLRRQHRRMPASRARARARARAGARARARARDEGEGGGGAGEGQRDHHQLDAPRRA